MGARTFAEGDVITLDGESGLICAGAVPTVTERPAQALKEIAAWRARPGPFGESRRARVRPSAFASISGSAYH
jgi:hypothetical protein